VGNGIEVKTQNFCRNCTEYSRRDFYRSHRENTGAR